MGTNAEQLLTEQESTKVTGMLNVLDKDFEIDGCMSLHVRLSQSKEEAFIRICRNKEHLWKIKNICGRWGTGSRPSIATIRYLLHLLRLLRIMLQANSVTILLF